MKKSFPAVRWAEDNLLHLRSYQYHLIMFAIKSQLRRSAATTISGTQTRFARKITTQTRFKLNTGAAIPAIGFGTFQDPQAQEDAVSRALKAGLRLIDTAQVYDVERQVGKGVEASGVPREDIFLGTKLWCNKYHPEDVEEALEQSLSDLNTPYVDLLLMHYPCTFARGEERFPRDSEGRMVHGDTSYVDTWRAMEKLVKAGKTKAIGISNFSKGEVETLIKESSTVRLSGQAYYPYNKQHELTSLL